MAQTQNLRPFQPGQSGNRSGRSKAEMQLAAACRLHAAEAMDILMGIARDGKQPAAARVMAVQVILDRAFGRAPARVRLDSDLASLDNAQLNHFIRDAIMEAIADPQAMPDAAE